MKNTLIIGFLLLLIFGCNRVQVKEYSMRDFYKDGTPKLIDVKRPYKGMNYGDPFQSPYALIYQEEAVAAWGIEDVGCKNFSITKDVAYEGNKSLKFVWDRTKKGCDFIGVGIAWNEWQAIDFKRLSERSALQFWIRTESETREKLPLRVAFSDVNDKQVFAALENRYLDGREFKPEWQKVNIPLAAWYLPATGMKLDAVKQLVIAFEGKGSIYVDDIRIVKFEGDDEDNPFNKSYVKDEPEIVDGGPVEDLLPLTCFDEEVTTNHWGIENIRCKDASLQSAESYSGNKALKIFWDKTGCDWIGWGMALNVWAPIDLSDHLKKTALDFYVKIEEGDFEHLPLQVGMSDWLETNTYLWLENRYVDAPSYKPGRWLHVQIPLQDFPYENNDAVTKSMKGLIFQATNKCKLYIDNIRLVEYSGKKGDPFNKGITTPVATYEFKPSLENILPVELYTEDPVGSVWGMEDGACKKVTVEEKDVKVEDQSLRISWDQTDDCDMVGWGMSFNNWKPLDVSKHLDQLAIEFYIKVPKGTYTELPMKIGLSDMDESAAFNPLTAQFAQVEEFNTEWQKVVLPFNKFNLGGNGVKPSKIKQVQWRGEGKFEILIDQVRLVSLEKL